MGHIFGVGHQQHFSTCNIFPVVIRYCLMFHTSIVLMPSILPPPTCVIQPILLANDFTHTGQYFGFLMSCRYSMAAHVYLSMLEFSVLVNYLWCYMESSCCTSPVWSVWILCATVPIWSPKAVWTLKTLLQCRVLCDDGILYPLLVVYIPPTQIKLLGLKEMLEYCHVGV